MALPDVTPHKDIRGLGLTDWHDYAPRLAETFSYQNTFYHMEPRLDISAPLIPDELLSSQDFVISSDVFEHVVPPVDDAFRNVCRMLRPGGALILTVPYGLQPGTIEHFPDLHDYTLIKNNNSYLMRNVTKTGTVQEFNDLVFHGGPGATIEMRVFGEHDLIERLRRVGFEDIEVYRTPDFEFGIWWPEPWSLPLSARKPK